MSFKKPPPFLAVAWISLICGTLPATAKILLKPAGENAQPLRAKSLQAEVRIDRQFAVTQLEWTFLNETRQRLEADFLYTLPPDAVATSFAYWCGEEKVVARVVEKERAAAIYQHITSRMRDPALIELIGKNTFRARIFPVMPHTDLRVEMQMVQVLPADSEGLSYTFPLVEGEAPPAALDSLRIHVQVKADASIRQVINNYGLPVTEEGITLAGTNYRPPKDLRIRLLRPARPLHAALYAAPSGGPDGFFALALTPDRALAQPRVTIRGVATYHVVPARLPDVKAHHSLLLVGRYRGHGRATVTLTGRSPEGPRSYSAAVEFGSRPEPNHLATKLWAARRAEQLSAHPTNRAAVVALSQRFGIPSRFTSWLAVPQAEMERYRREKIQAEMATVASQLASEIARGRERGPAARRLRLQLNALGQRSGRDPQEALFSQLYSRMYELASQIVWEKHSSQPDPSRIAALRRELNRLARATKRPAERLIEEAEYPWTRRQIERVRTQLLAEYRREKPDRLKVRRLEAQFTALNRQVYSADYARARTERLAVKVDLEKLDQALQVALPGSTERAELEKKQVALQKREEELRARMGDPLLEVEAPAEAQRVVALLPTGEVKPLAFNPVRQRWEARFDIPVDAPEGAYLVTVIIVLQDGSRKVLTLRYHVDLTPPNGAGKAQRVTAAEPTLRLEMEADADTARVAALLPWGERADLKPSTRPNGFWALVPVPPAYQGRALGVTFVLTDRAHNRTKVRVEAGE